MKWSRVNIWRRWYKRSPALTYLSRTAFPQPVSGWDWPSHSSHFLMFFFLFLISFLEIYVKPILLSAVKYLSKLMDYMGNSLICLVNFAPVTTSYFRRAVLDAGFCNGDAVQRMTKNLQHPSTSGKSRTIISFLSWIRGQVLTEETK